MTNELLARISLLEKENQRLNNDIKVLLKENEAKEKVIIKYDNVLNELEIFIKDGIKQGKCYTEENDGKYVTVVKQVLEKFLDKLNELKESDK